ncbi:hypothetical protein DERF_007651 [Dermatophagoides farinae]|uniref:Uncharacterized protein n=1 Tax=Dermatophagoides farinae TaxID=6954 RepID=A0A922L3E1_DERFA|nr:hypothetical protein DERF_007651 [Dermatophagoides farinae]
MTIVNFIFALCPEDPKYFNRIVG